MCLALEGFKKITQSGGLCDSPLERGGGVCCTKCGRTHPRHNTSHHTPSQEGSHHNAHIHNSKHILSFGEDLGEAKMPGEPLSKRP
jgi:hypothetical protein